MTASAFSSTTFNTGFLTKLNTNGSGAASLVYSTFLGPTGFAEGHAIAADATGNVYITGSATNSGIFPQAFPAPGGPELGSRRGGNDVLVAKIVAADLVTDHHPISGDDLDDLARRQGVTVESGDALVPLPNGQDAKEQATRPRHCLHARRLCHQRLAALPPEALKLYRSRVDGQAKTLVEHPGALAWL